MAVLDPRVGFQACYTRLCTFYTGGLWQGDARGLKGFFQRSLRVLVLSIRGLIVNRSLIRASALAYLTGLAMIPIMALLFTILKSLGIQRLLAEPLLEHLAPGSKEFRHANPALHREYPGGLPGGFRHCGAAGRPDHADDQHRVGLQRHLAGGPHPALAAQAERLPEHFLDLSPAHGGGRLHHHQHPDPPLYFAAAGQVPARGPAGHQFRAFSP